MVVDETNGRLLGEVTGIHGAHGTAIAEQTGHGFATSADDSSVVMFDLAPFKVLSRVHAAEDADAIICDPPSNRVFVDECASAGDGNTLGLSGGRAVRAAATGGRWRAKATPEGSGGVIRADGRGATLTRPWKCGP